MGFLFVRRRGGRRRRGSRPEFLAIPILVQRLGIGQGLDVGDCATVDYVADRELDNLVALGARNVGDLDNLCLLYTSRCV